MAKQISAKNLIVGGLTSLAFNASIGASAAYFGEFHFIGGFLAANLICHIPMSLAVSDALRQELGLKSPIQIAGNWVGRPGNKIKVTANNKSKDIFMSMLPSGLQTEPETVDQLDTITVWLNNERYDVLFYKLEEFIFSSYRRQGQGKAGLSRRYWTEIRRPVISNLDYNLMMEILTSVDGLVINRSERRSGKLSVSPKIAIETIQNTV